MLTTTTPTLHRPRRHLPVAVHFTLPHRREPITVPVYFASAGPALSLVGGTLGCDAALTPSDVLGAVAADPAVRALLIVPEGGGMEGVEGYDEDDDLCDGGGSGGGIELVLKRRRWIWPGPSDTPASFSRLLLLPPEARHEEGGGGGDETEMEIEEESSPAAGTSTVGGSSSSINSLSPTTTGSGDGDGVDGSVLLAQYGWHETGDLDHYEELATVGVKALLRCPNGEWEEDDDEDDDDEEEEEDEDEDERRRRRQQQRLLRVYDEVVVEVRDGGFLDTHRDAAGGGEWDPRAETREAWAARVAAALPKTPYPIFLQRISGRQLALAVVAGTTVGEVVRMAGRAEGYPAEALRLVFHAQALEKSEARTLASYGIGPGATVHLLLRIGKPGPRTDEVGLLHLLRNGTEATQALRVPSLGTAFGDPAFRGLLATARGAVRRAVVVEKEKQQQQKEQQKQAMVVAAVEEGEGAEVEEQQHQQQAKRCKLA